MLVRNPAQEEKPDDRLKRIEDILRNILDIRARDSSRELIDLELQILKIRSRLASAT